MNKLLDELMSVFNPNEGPHIHSIVELPMNDEVNPQIELSLGSRQIECDITVPSTLTVFDGHFPGHAVFPGVVQIDWVGKLALLLFDGLGEFKKLNNIEFTSMVLPDTRLKLTLNFQAEKQQVKFLYSNQHAQYSSGTLVYLNV